MPTQIAMCFLGHIRSALVSRSGSHCFPRVSTNSHHQFQRIHAPDQDPLLSQLALGVVLRADFEEEVHELLQRFRLARHYESDDVHQKARLGIAIEHDGENLLLRGCQTASFGMEGQSQWHERTMVSIFCSSLPFSRACLNSFCDGMSAALSWWTYCALSAI